MFLVSEPFSRPRRYERDRLSPHGKLVLHITSDERLEKLRSTLNVSRTAPSAIV
jgi:hypothetical protein